MTTSAKGKRLDAAAAAALIRPRDVLLCGFVAGQPVALLEAIGERTDLEDVVLYCGILGRPYALLRNPAMRVVSGFFGPVERMARAAGGQVSFLPADFHGLERLALRLEPQSGARRHHAAGRRRLAVIRRALGRELSRVPRSGARSRALGDRRAELEDAASRGDRRSRRQSYPRVRGRRLGRARRRSGGLARGASERRRSRHRGGGLRTHRAGRDAAIRHRRHPRRDRATARRAARVADSASTRR